MFSIIDQNMKDAIPDFQRVMPNLTAWNESLGVVLEKACQLEISEETSFLKSAAQDLGMSLGDFKHEKEFLEGVLQENKPWKLRKRRATQVLVGVRIVFLRTQVCLKSFRVAVATVESQLAQELGAEIERLLQ